VHIVILILGVRRRLMEPYLELVLPDLVQWVSRHSPTAPQTR
jgi:hypothetical protein